jgi:hypothetical protein
MGTNCAVFVANQYLFSHEFAFVSFYVTLALAATPDANGTEAQRASHMARFILRLFAFTARFVDDLFYIGIPGVLDRAQYQDPCLPTSVRGIYPRALTLELTGGGDDCVYMDLRIFKRPVAAGHLQPAGSLTTHLYDKRRGATFAGIPIVRYPHISSMVGDRCRYNVLTSQVIRYSRIIMDKHNFVVECAALVRAFVCRGYDAKRLLNQLRRLLLHTPHIFDAYGPLRLFSEIAGHLPELVCGELVQSPPFTSNRPLEYRNQ